MGRVLRCKPCYRLSEVCDRWGVDELDVANFVAVGGLTLSLVVIGLPLEEGTIEEVDPGRFADLPERQFRFTGLLDLWPRDAWSVLTEVSHIVTDFRTERRRYRRLWFTSIDAAGYEIARDRLVVRHAELERFEAAQAGMMGEPAAREPTAVQRGATPRYDWDAFWGEALVSVVQDGCPSTLAEFVRRMEMWFASRDQHPDTSTIKKKLTRPWRRIAPLLQHGA